jgi:hypothetical protein
MSEVKPQTRQKQNNLPPECGQQIDGDDIVGNFTHQKNYPKINQVLKFMAIEC